jgi:hypothetical protein
MFDSEWQENSTQSMFVSTNLYFDYFEQIKDMYLKKIP